MTAPDITRLSPRQLEILKMRGQLMKGIEIAKALGISQNTVKRHVQHIRATMNPPVLTPTEKNVARLICTGLSNKEIAVALGSQTKTVEAHRFNLYRKLNVHNVVQLINTVPMKKMRAHA